MIHFRLFAVSACLWFAASALASTTIRVLNIYQNSAIAALDLLGGPTAVFSRQLDVLNASLGRSGVDILVVSVGILSINNLPGTNLLDLLSESQKSFDILRLRDAALADIVIVAGDFTYEEYSGYAAATPAVAATAFAVVNVGDLVSTSYTYQHEFAHLLGAHHQYSGAKDKTSNYTVGIAHGYYIRSTFAFWPYASCLHTIMAYEPEDNLFGVTCIGGSDQIGYFSNPAISIPGILTYLPTPTGSASKNNAQQLNLYAAEAASWHNTPLAAGRVAIIDAIVNIVLE